jgi:hypothetical protein
MQVILHPLPVGNVDLGEVKRREIGAQRQGRLMETNLYAAIRWQSRDPSESLLSSNPLQIAIIVCCALQKPPDRRYSHAG